jgi:hypothetical protein
MANKVRLFLDAAKNISDEKESDALRGQLFDLALWYLAGESIIMKTMYYCLSSHG